MLNDLISRQAAIDVVKKNTWAGARIMQLPPAQPERKKGKWIYGEDEYGIDGYHCDKCGFFVPWDYNHKLIDYINDYVYCPNCGAKRDGKIEGRKK